MKIPAGNIHLPQRRDHMVEKLGDERASAIPCPVISTLLMEDMLTPDADGNISIEQLRKALDGLGISSLPKHGLAFGAANAIGGSFFAKTINVFELFGSSLDHKGSLGPLQDGGFNEGLLAQLKSFSSDGESLTLEDIGTAQLVRLEQEDGGFRDKLIGRAELTALLLVFGTPNKAGDKALSLADVDTLFRDNRIPDSFKEHSTGAISLAWGMTKLAFLQNTTAAGRAETGLRDALEQSRPLGAEAALAGLGAMCPAGMRPKGGVGVSEPEIDKLHQALSSDVGAEQSASSAQS